MNKISLFLFLVLISAALGNNISYNLKCELESAKKSGMKICRLIENGLEIQLDNEVSI
jgi:hypothetical protein